ncbi:MAG: hypothetical protein PHE78_08755, partial [Candidatus Gastranaerophilales bacterium]|nr:hypothetical protein [Candidatus Gastranaerophilales bacterium]
ALATAGSIIATFFNGIFQEIRFRKQLKLQREQWLNDAFAKKEAELWIEFREKIVYQLQLFLTLNEWCFKKENNYYSENDWKENFITQKTEINDILNLLYKLKPYWNINLDYKRTEFLLQRIHSFYFNLIVETKEPRTLFGAQFLYKKETEDFLKDKYIITDSSFIKYMFFETIENLFPNKIQHLKLIQENIPLDYKAEVINKSIKLFKQEIDSINDALNEKVTAHLKNK